MAATTAFDVYDAAFDSAQSEYHEDTTDYVIGYAAGALDLQLSPAVAQRIIDCRRAFKVSQQGSDNFYRLVQEPLESISI